MSPSLDAYLAHLRAAECVPRPDDEPWPALIARICEPGRVAAIDPKTFDYFLNVLPPKYQGDATFAFAEGAEPLRLFWQAGGHFFCRQLTWEETALFCQRSSTAFPYWH